jgi:soluble lytic murein transglycosylase
LIRGVTLLILFLAVGCSSTPILPPASLDSLMESVVSGDYSLSKELTPLEYASKSFLIGEKLEGDGESVSSCSYYQKSIEQRTPLYYPTLLKLLGHCKLTGVELSALWEKQRGSIIPGWVADRYYQLSLELAKKYRLTRWTIHFSLAWAPLAPHQSVGVKVLQDAISLAEQEQLGSELASLQRQLTTIAPRFFTSVDGENSFLVAKDLEFSRKFKRSREIYQKIINDEQSNLSLRVKAYNRLRRSYKKERKLKEYLLATHQMDRWLADLVEQGLDGALEAWGECRLNLARGLWTQDQNSAAKEVLYQLLLDGVKRDVAHFILARVYQEEKSPFRAIIHLRQTIELSDDPRHIDLSRWNLAWSLMESGDLKRALMVLQQQIEYTLDSSVRFRALFWHGMISKRLGKEEQANSSLQRVMSEDQFGYYGLVARLQLGAALDQIEKLVVPDQPPGWTPPVLRWLLAFKQIPLAHTFLRSSRSRVQGDDQLVESLALYKQAQFYSGLIRQFYRISPERRQELSSYVSWIFPQPFLPIVQKSAIKHQISQELIYSIMRQESAFDPLARSVADAFGLLQLTPESARDAIGEKKRSALTSEMLYTPTLNIDLGSKMLRERLKRYDNNIIFTVASYNAGHSVVEKWREQRFKGSFLEFIETIPYKETRNYVKLVIRNAFNYHRLGVANVHWPAWSAVLH